MSLILRSHCITFNIALSCPLVTPNYGDDVRQALSVTRVGSSSVSLQWRQLSSLPQGIPDLGQYYGYRLTYMPNGTQQAYEHGNYNHDTHSVFLSAVVSGLYYSQPYVFKVQPYRQWDGSKEYGRTYLLVIATTLCIGR